MQNSLSCYLLNNKVIATYVLIYSQEMEIITSKEPLYHTGDIIAMGFKLSEVDVKTLGLSFTCDYDGGYSVPGIPC